MIRYRPQLPRGMHAVAGSMCSRSESLAGRRGCIPPGGSLLPENFRFRPFDFLGWARCNIIGRPGGLLMNRALRSRPFGLRSSRTLVDRWIGLSGTKDRGPRALSPRSTSRCRTAVDQGTPELSLGSLLSLACPLLRRVMLTSAPNKWALHSRMLFLAALGHP